jgi:Flp pilus assembly protein TadG
MEKTRDGVGRFRIIESRVEPGGNVMHRRLETGVASPRRGVAASELALILPLFVLLFVIAVDFGRVFYVEYIVINAARCGAVYGSTNPTCAQDAAGIQQRVQAEAKDLDPQLMQITSTTGTDSAGNPCIDVTVNYPFKMVTNYLISTNLNVASRIRMRVGPVLPASN